MSVRMSSLVWDRFPDGGSKLIVMHALADCANDDGGSIYPSVPTLASKCRMKDRRVRQILSDLEHAGWITREHQGSGGNPQNTTHWRINVRVISESPVLDHAHKRVQRSSGVQPATPLPLDSGVKRGTTTPATTDRAPLQSVVSTPVRECRGPTTNPPDDPSMNHQPGGGCLLRGDVGGLVGEAEQTNGTATAPEPNGRATQTPEQVDARRRELAEQSRIVRQTERAKEMLVKAGVLRKNIGAVLTRAAKHGGGDPLPRVQEVVKAGEQRAERMKQRGEEFSLGGYVHDAIVGNWDVSGKTRERQRA